MKLRRTLIGMRRQAVVAMAMVAMVAPRAATWGGEPGPEQLQRESEEWERLAVGLKEEGRHDEAKQRMRQAEEVRARAEQVERERGERREMPERHRAELKQALAELRAHRAELEAAGKLDEAAEVERHMDELGSELRAREAGPEGRPEGRRMAPEARPRERRPGPPEALALEAKLHHLMVAVDNLHAAGMHDLAERVAERAEALRRELARRPEREAPVLGRSAALPEQLRDELEEIRHALSQLRGEIDDLRRERR